MGTRSAIRIGLIGCGTVGTGVLQVLRDNAADIRARLGMPLEVRAIVVRDLERERDAVVPRDLLGTEPAVVTDADDIDVVLELVGGYEPARTLVMGALAAGKHVVTANKALLARHGAEIFRAARDAHRDVIFEASVGGGIPIIRMLREGLASDHVQSLRAIINGTSNYILTAMSRDGASYADALAAAQELGFAEADPSMDVDGTDAAQKLSILASLGFGAQVPYEEIVTEGIDGVSDLDMGYAHSFGYGIKPLAVARMHADGIEARVHPALVPADGLLAHVHGAFNALRVQSRALGPLLFQGQGAGMLPTAAAVVSDVIEAGRNVLGGSSGRLPHLAFHEDLVTQPRLRRADETCCPFYLRFAVRDEAGVLGVISTALGKRGVSISRMVQDRPHTDGPVQVVMLTHTANEGDVRQALMGIQAEGVSVEPCQVLRVEDEA